MIMIMILMAKNNGGAMNAKMKGERQMKIIIMLLIIMVWKNMRIIRGGVMVIMVNGQNGINGDNAW